MENRKTGWLDARFLYKFREIQTHVAFRYQIAVPIFCLMPDHIHLLWAGLSADSDQRTAMRTLRRETNNCLRGIGYALQKQAYDHVLQGEEQDRSAIEDTVEYIARNPERKAMIAVDQFAAYPYTGCVLPGFPSVRLFGDAGWESLWRTISFLRRTDVFRRPDPIREAAKKNIT